MGWQLDINTAIVIAVNLLALSGAYFGLKADNAKLGSDLALQMSEERSQRAASQSMLRSDLMGVITTIDTCVKDLTRRVGTLEAGQDEWTKTLRDRTHELSNHLQALVLKVDRLERPTAHALIVDDHK